MTNALPWQLEAEGPPERGNPHDLRLWSVTTVIRQVGAPDGLVAWAAGRTADAALDDYEIVGAMLERGQRGDAYKYLTGARFRPRAGATLTDADAGTEFHRLAERWIFDQSRPPCDYPEVTPLLDSFARWLEEFTPRYEALEMTVYHPEHLYAGTLDAIINVDGHLYVLDYKTSLDPDQGSRRKRPWHSVAPQLAAYRHAQYVAVWKARTEEKWSRRYYLLSEDERRNALPMPAIEGGYCLHITPDHADLYPVRCGEDIFRDGFLAATDAANWTLRLADTALDVDGAILLNTR